MPYFPLFINLVSRPVLIVGGGHIALHKITKLLEFSPDITVVAPDICPEIISLSQMLDKTNAESPVLSAVKDKASSSHSLSSDSPLAYIPKPAPPASVSIISERFRPEHLDGFELCIAATDDHALNSLVSELCRKKKIPVNVVDDPKLCTFIFPSIIKRDELSIGISTGGMSPSAAAYLRRTLGSSLPDGIGDIISYMGSIRGLIHGRFSDADMRSSVLTSIFELCLEKGRRLTDSELDPILEHASQARNAQTD